MLLIRKVFRSPISKHFEFMLAMEMRFAVEAKNVDELKLLIVHIVRILDLLSLVIL